MKLRHGSGVDALRTEPWPRIGHHDDDPRARPTPSQRSQKIQNGLFLFVRKMMKVLDYLIRFRASGTMLPDSLHQIRCSSIISIALIDRYEPLLLGSTSSQQASRTL